MRTKTRQIDSFTPGETNVNAAASLQKPQGRNRAEKHTESNKKRYMGALKRQFRFRLRSEINKCVVTDAEASIKATDQPIQQFLNSNYRTKNLQTVNLWRNYVKKNFDDVKRFVLKGDDGDDNSNEESDNDEEEEEAEEEEEEYQDIQQRTCSASLSSIIRKDLPPAVRQAFMDTTNITIVQVSNYMAEFSKQVLKIALLFNDHAFSKQNRRIALVPQEGISLDPVLPVGNLDYTVRVPKPVDADCLKDPDFCSKYSQLFQLPHLELIHSTYYGALGVQESSLKATPLHREIVEAVPRDDPSPYEALSSHAMKMARQLYETNFQNMWADSTTVNKLLTRLLRFLLLIHLCPDQDCDFKAKKEELQDKSKGKGKGKGKQVLRDTNTSIPVESISLINKTRNGRRRLFRNEQQRKKKHEDKGNTRAAERCQVRLDTYREVLARERREREKQRGETYQQQQPVESYDIEEQLVQDEIKAEKSQDISKRRLGNLAYIEKKLEQATEKEIDVISRIVVFVKPYIPPKVNYRSFAFQLPFVLMANQVLRSIGRESQVVKITPIVSPTSLKALAIDTATLFSLFCSKDATSKMYLQDYSGRLIQAKSALYHKDAVLGSFFDMQKLHSLAKDYGMEFNHRMHIIPGLKTVRISGIVSIMRTKPKTLEPAKADNQDMPSDENEHDDETLAKLNDRKTALEKLLRDRTKELHQFLVENGSVRSRRKGWKQKPDERQDIGSKRYNLKVETRERMTRHRHPNTVPATNPIIIDSKPSLHKAEECELSDRVSLTNAVFAGTDNGLIKTTETVFFDIERFALHLELYRHFHISEDPMDINDIVSSTCLNLPETHTVGPKQIAQQTGLTSYTISLVSKKKRTAAGHQVMETEELLSGCSIHQSTTAEELDRNYQQQSVQEETAPGIEQEESPGHGVGSRIKGHQRFGGTWKQEIHGRYTPTVITNEYNSSQTCLFCFRKLSHPLKTIGDEVKTINGSFVCINNKCPNAFKVMCRDQVSALAIGLAGLASILFGVTFPCFDQQPSRLKRQQFNDLALSFLEQKQQQA
ncbi:hypothetical protein HMPREF1544_08603 [Mucor circinelloides 1006PhL]|uniref:Uncharacterized protein n=1 Tax=Mucor circinelloides f. circinelloides (strain 1006PhL) TaxID=1220926 RepID=S2JXT5_MUCC1|nr:hypothetical protein HMPREF1544_08603 [Mucor circinelloides 1006PhL]